jgi:heme exporter protein CcmD
VDSLGSWPSMGNYGFYILMTYGATLILMLLEPLVLKSQRKSLLRDVVRLMKINANRK